MVASKYHSDILYNGAGAFVNDDTDTPNATFWQHMDFILTEAEGYGLYVAITVMWAEDYQALIGTDLDKAYRLGHWLGTRYQNRNNVLSVVSGEYNDTSGWTTSLYESVAQGLMDGHQGNHLMTIHPSGAQSSARDFHESSWLSFNILQSGHQSDNQALEYPENYEVITHDYRLSPAKPVADGEPAYEDFIDGSFDDGTSDIRIEADTVRRKAYWAVFAGAFGHTYGNENVEIMYIPGDEDNGFPHRYWKEALHNPGAMHMRHVRTLMESKSFLNRIPDQSIIASTVGSGLDHVQATRASDGTYAMIYIPRGGSVDVNLAKITGQGVAASWFNPRDGSTTQIGPYPNTGTRIFDAPGGVANGNDWDPSARFHEWHRRSSGDHVSGGRDGPRGGPAGDGRGRGNASLLVDRPDRRRAPRVCHGQRLQHHLHGSGGRDVEPEDQDSAHGGWRKRHEGLRYIKASPAEPEDHPAPHDLSIESHCHGCARQCRGITNRHGDVSEGELGFCRKVQFWGQNPKIGYQKFNDLQTPKRSKKQICDRTVHRSRQRFHPLRSDVSFVGIGRREPADRLGGGFRPGGR